MIPILDRHVRCRHWHHHLVHHRDFFCATHPHPLLRLPLLFLFQMHNLLHLCSTMNEVLKFHLPPAIQHIVPVMNLPRSHCANLVYLLNCQVDHQKLLHSGHLTNPPAFLQEIFLVSSLQNLHCCTLRTNQPYLLNRQVAHHKHHHLGHLTTLLQFHLVIRVVSPQVPHRCTLRTSQAGLVCHQVNRQRLFHHDRHKNLPGILLIILLVNRLRIHRGTPPASLVNLLSRLVDRRECHHPAHR